MGDFFFVVKAFLFTIAVVILLQIKVGDSTIEERSHTLLQQSAIHKTLSKVALGAVTAIKDGVDYVQHWVAHTTQGQSKSASTAER